MLYNMEVATTIAESVKVCSKCNETKHRDLFVKRLNSCKKCASKSSCERRKRAVVDNTVIKTCNVCNAEKPMGDFMTQRKICRDCHNEARRNRFNEDEEFRSKKLKRDSEYKQKKTQRNQQKRLDEQTRIGLDNKVCSKCSEIKHRDRFRHNRLKCKDCERDDPLDKFKRAVRCRIYTSLHKKTLHTVDYLGVNSVEYLKWMVSYDERYTLDNKGEWHIDHVIPLSSFDLDCEEQQMIAFNWRNTMPLLARDNLAKNNKIVPLQIQEHYEHLLDYHEKNNIQLPEKFVSLFAKHLVAGTP